MSGDVIKTHFNSRDNYLVRLRAIEKGAAINVCLETFSGSSRQARKNSVKSLFCVRAFAPFYSISKHGISNFT